MCAVFAKMCVRVHVYVCMFMCACVRVHVCMCVRVCARVRVCELGLCMGSVCIFMLSMSYTETNMCTVVHTCANPLMRTSM